MSETSGHCGVIVIGAGFAGIGLASRLLDAGFDDFVVLERAESVGGTWRDNTYPGLTCDVPSHLYSYSFAPNPDWSRLFAPQAEIKAYLERCADMPPIRERLRLGVSVLGAAWDDEARIWTVETSDGPMTARVVVSGAGHALTEPVYPDVPGREEFGGVTMHSARWDHDVELDGKSVAVVGTGASAVQIIPSIADRVGSLSVFQRTPAWVLPKPDWPTSALERSVYRTVPAVQKLARAGSYAIFESFALGHVFFPRINAIHDWRGRRFLERSVADPELRRKLTPSFRFGCKRILLSNDYYPALQKPHVELVTEPIETIAADGVRTADGRTRAFDVIIFATGYVAAEAGPPFPIAGRGGRTLIEDWNGGGGEAYLGTTISGYPNLFLIIGPNCGLGHNSMVYMMESQFAYVVDALRYMREHGMALVDVRPDVQDSYNEWVQERLSRSVWNTGGCRSWYLTADGRNTTIWPGFTFEYRARTRRFDAGSYERVSAVG